MNPLSVNDLRELATIRATPCISIYLPTRRAASDIPADQLRLRNLRREAEARLRAAGWRAGEAPEVLGPIETLLGDSFAWRHMREGLALFLAASFARAVTLPQRCEPKLALARHFILRPLLPMLASPSPFYILALSQNAVRLFRATPEAVEEIQLDTLPRNLAEALRFDTWQPEIRFRSGAPVGAGRWSAIFYGSGGDQEAYKEELAQYCRRIDQCLCDWLAGQNVRLVLAGVEYVLALYRAVSRYPHLAEPELAGNADRISPEQLRDEAQRLLEPQRHERQARALAAWRRWIGSPRATLSLRAALPAAQQGRVQSLLLARDREQWGTYDCETQTIHLLDAPDARADELLDLLATQTLLHHGEVFALPMAEMPTDAPLAAVLRF
jgi:hypothetical protein